jgi:dTDP-glucose 4,6-dehydratase
VFADDAASIFNLPMKYAILGGGGCFGLNCARYLLGLGHSVIGCGRSALRGPAFTLGTELMGYRYRQLSVGSDNEFLVEWLDAEAPDIIVNFAAQGEGAASFRARHWKYFYRTNVEALVELTEMLQGRAWLKRFIQVGTSEVYGSVAAPAGEDSPLRPSSPYAVSKLAFDQHLVSIARAWDFPAIVVRPSNCLCAGQQLHRVVPKFFLLEAQGIKLPLHGGGRARKSYMDAEDLSAAIALLAERGEVGEIYNAGPDQPLSIRALIDIAADCVNTTVEQACDLVADRPGQDGIYWLDSARLKALGWRQQVPLEAAVARVAFWVANHLEALRGLPVDYEMRA